MIQIEPDKKLDFDSVLITPQFSMLSSRSQVDLEREFTFTHKIFDLSNNRTTMSISWKGIPIIAANMDTVGTFAVYSVLSQYKMLTAMNKFYTLSDYRKQTDDGIILDPDYFMVSTGITDANFLNLVEILEHIPCNWICIDVANGYIDSFLSFCVRVRRQFPDKIIVAGNVVSYDCAEHLIRIAGVNVVKVGIGPGSACLTRKKTGIGIPQLSAILETKRYGQVDLVDGSVKQLDYIISDGGIKWPGDVAKAFGAGADFVMIGGAFAGHDENPGEIIEECGEKYKLFYGQSSELAMKKHYGGMEKYRASEGAVLKIKYKGALKNTVQDYLGGLRSACTYINARTIREMPGKTVFVLV